MSSIRDFHKEKYDKTRKNLIEAVKEHYLNTNAMIGMFDNNSVVKDILKHERRAVSNLLRKLPTEKFSNKSDSSMCSNSSSTETKSLSGSWSITSMSSGSSGASRSHEPSHSRRN